MDQKKLTILTLIVVVAGAVTVNEVVIRVAGKEQNREVASFGERFVPEQIKWEQELAKTVAQQTGTKTLIGAKPSLSEKFLYEALEGRYNAQVVNGKLLKITLNENQEAVTLNTQDVLGKYSEVFKGAKSFESASASSVPGEESVVLKNADGKQIGLLTIRRNTDGRVLGLEIQ